jgi:LPXTG-motif cell wall-anchored protein
MISLAVMTPARAQEPPANVNAAAATATALQLTLLGQSLAVSQTQAAVGENGFAAADGAALLLAGTPVPGGAPAVAGGDQETNEVCPLELDLDEATAGALSALQLEIACVRTSATPGAARSASDEVIIRVLAPGGDLVAPILGPVLDAVDQVTDPLVEALAPLLGIVKDVTQIDVPSVLDQLTTALQDDLFVLAEIIIAPSISEATFSEDAVSAEAGSNAITINVLPGLASTLDVVTDLIDVPNPSSGPLLQVKLGAANAQVVKNLDGTTQPDASAAQLLSITADDSLGILQGLTGTLTDVLDLLSITQLSCEGGALADILCIDLGHVNELSHDELVARNLDFGPDTAGIEASAATIRVLPIAAAALGGDHIGHSLASATAAANAVDTPRVAPPAAPPAATPAAPLPKTGTESALPLTLALLAVGMAGALLVRRTRTI